MQRSLDRDDSLPAVATSLAVSVQPIHWSYRYREYAAPFGASVH